MWLKCIGAVSGCCCKEVYRFPHDITYPYSTLFFGKASLLLCSFLKCFFVLVYYILNIYYMYHSIKIIAEVHNIPRESI